MEPLLLVLLRFRRPPENIDRFSSELPMVPERLLFPLPLVLLGIGAVVTFVLFEMRLRKQKDVAFKIYRYWLSNSFVVLGSRF